MSQTLFAPQPRFAPLAASVCALPGNLSVHMYGGRALVATVARAGVLVAPMAVADLTQPAGGSVCVVGSHDDADQADAMPWLQATWVFAGGDGVLAVLGFGTAQFLDARGHLLYRHALSIDPGARGPRGVGAGRRGRGPHASVGGQTRPTAAACARSPATPFASVGLR